MTDKSDVAGLETTAKERAEVCKNLERGDWTGLKLAAMHRDFDRLTAALASEREARQKAEEWIKIVSDDVRKRIPEGQNKDQADSPYAAVGCMAILTAERDALARKVTELEAVRKQAAYMDTLRDLLGYVQDGSSATVTIGQDDATRWWTVVVGNQTYRGETLREAIEKAAKGDARAVLKKENAGG